LPLSCVSLPERREATVNETEPRPPRPLALAEEIDDLRRRLGSMRSADPADEEELHRLGDDIRRLATRLRICNGEHREGARTQPDL
jgi:hypothetical protein